LSFLIIVVPFFVKLRSAKKNRQSGGACSLG
jgi:hypothetical protein